MRLMKIFQKLTRWRDDMRADEHDFNMGKLTPISGYCETVSGNSKVLNYMFPMDGEVIEGLVHVEKLPSGGVELVASVNTANGVMMRSVKMTEGKALMKIDMKVSKMDRLEVVVNGAAEGVSVAFTWRPKG